MKAQYFASLPEAKVLVDQIQRVVRQRGYVKNVWGRRRRLKPDECYKAPNALIQGCAADFIKYKIVKMYKYLMYNNLKSHMTNIVHDEIIINIYEDELEHAPMLRWLMSDFEAFRCPITAGSEYSETDWGHKTEKDIGFTEPTDKGFLEYDVFNGEVFNIRR